MTIIKSPNTKLPEIVEKVKKQGKRKRRETLCVDKRRDFDHCGICGSADLVFEQLVYCDKCGAEKFTIDIKSSLGWRIPKRAYPCDCKGEKFYIRGKAYHRGVHGDFTVRMCLSCSSVEAPTCPACLQADKNPNRPYAWNTKCWTSPVGEKYCRRCGYRFPGYGKQ